jgi:hypothetical protein
MKICNKCNEEKELSEFHFRKNRNKHVSVCKFCVNKNTKIRYHKNLEESREYRRNIKYLKRNKETKQYKVKELFKLSKSTESVCSKCLLIKSKSDFNKDKSKKNNIDTYCKSCRNEYLRERKKIDINFKLICNLRSSLSDSLRKMKLTKQYKTKNILGIDINDFKSYIESKFKTGMSWENYGNWHIDHIIPISYANSIDEIYELSHYSNLQPLWEKENLIKGNRYIG